MMLLMWEERSAVEGGERGHSPKGNSGEPHGAKRTGSCSWTATSIVLHLKRPLYVTSQASRFRAAHFHRNFSLYRGTAPLFFWDLSLPDSSWLSAHWRERNPLPSHKTILGYLYVSMYTYIHIYVYVYITKPSLLPKSEKQTGQS